jgi:hypothetical protein
MRDQASRCRVGETAGIGLHLAYRCRGDRGRFACEEGSGKLLPRMRGLCSMRAYTPIW